MEREVKPKLNIGQTYKIDPYPMNVSEAKYIGENNKKYVFSGEEYYFFVNKDEIVDNDGTITHNHFSSSRINTFPKSALKLVNILQKLGEL